MNLERKCALQKRQIESLQNQIEKLEKELSIQSRKNTVLKEKLCLYESQITHIENMKREFFKELEEVKELKANYQKVISDAIDVRNDYSIKFKKLIGRFLLKI